MSRIGKQPIQVPSGVTITVDEHMITVSGSKGTLTQPMLEGINVLQNEQVINVTRESDNKPTKGWHGLQRTLISNMIVGVTDGFKKQLEIQGVGYRAALVGTDLKLQVGFSHDVIYKVVSGIQVIVEQNIITVSGINKQQVGQVAAEIRAIKKPEPYKGKGIRYVGERVLRKSGKSGKDK
jgi:large subunit ribosomal protein L6